MNRLFEPLLKKEALVLGFDDIKIIPYQRLDKDLVHLKEWLGKQYHATMSYMKEGHEKRAEPKLHLNDCQSIIVLCQNYRKKTTPSAFRIAQYALEKDYHQSLKGKLTILMQLIQKEYASAECISFCDAHPVMERAFAKQAGLGFIGKNTMLIHKKLGSFMFLCGIFTNIKLHYDEKTLQGSCGTCRACLDACPTQAFVKPYELDAGKCISFLTIENKQGIPPALEKQMGNWVFGCDICQDVCPHNMAPSKISRTVDDDPRVHPEAILNELLKLESNKAFQKKFHPYAVSRAGRKGMIRNFSVAIANSKDKQWHPFLYHFKDDANPFIREQSQKALRRVQDDV